MSPCLAALLAVMLLLYPLRHSEAVEISVAVQAGWPPMEFLNDEGEVAGFSIDFVNAVAREAGFTVKYVIVPWERIFDGLLAGEYDAVASSVSITPERKAIMDFSMPYYEVQQTVIAPVDSNIRSLGDLSGKKLGVQADTTGHFTAVTLEGVEAAAFEEVEQALDALLNGLLDGAIVDDPIATSFILESKDASRKMKVVLTIPTSEPEYYGIAVNKRNTGLLELLDAGITGVLEKGVDGDIRRKWIGF